MKYLKHLLALALLLAAINLKANAASSPVTVTVTGTTAGATPFIGNLAITINEPALLKTITFTIKPMTGSTTRPLSASYTIGYLDQRQFVNETTGAITVPVFGLYANYNNTVTMAYELTNGKVIKSTVQIQTAAWSDPSDGQVYLNPTVVQALSAHTTLSYSFILLKNFATGNTPILIDTDCRVRWVGPSTIATQAVAMFDNAFYISGGTDIVREDFDGTFAEVQDTTTWA